MSIPRDQDANNTERPANINVAEVRMALYASGQFSKHPIGAATVPGWIAYCRTGTLPAAHHAADPDNASGIYFALEGEDGWRARKALERYSNGTFGLVGFTRRYRKALAEAAAAGDEEAIRAVKDSKSADLLAVAPAARPEVEPVSQTRYAARNRKSAQPTGLIAFDVDGGDEKAAADLRNRLQTDVPYIVAAGVSVSGRGVWALAAADRTLAAGDEDYKLAWWWCARDLHRNHGLAVGDADGKLGADRAPSNPVSLRFAGLDAESWWRPAAQPMHLPPMDDLPKPQEVQQEIAGTGRQDDAPKTTETEAPRRQTGTPVVGDIRIAGGKVPRDPNMRPKWVAAAREAGEKTHDRMLKATLADAHDDRVDLDTGDARSERSGQYAQALNEHAGRPLDDARAEVERAIEGACEKAAEDAGNGEINLGTPYRKNPLPHIPIPVFWNPPPPGGWPEGTVKTWDEAERRWHLVDNERDCATEKADPGLPGDEVLYVDLERDWRVFLPPMTDDEIERKQTAADAAGLHADLPGGWETGSELSVAGWVAETARMNWGKIVGKKDKQGNVEEYVPVTKPEVGGTWAKASATLKMLKTITQRRTKPDDWNVKRNILGLPGGRLMTVTADGWNVRIQQAKDRVTGSLPCTPATDWTKTDFARFLDRVAPGGLGGSAERWLKRAFGYALVADGSERAFAWLKGQPQSGKSTLVNYLAGALGQSVGSGYFQAMACDLLLVRRSSQHDARIAKLHACRAAYWAEGKAGGRVDAERIKTFVGGDITSANFMRQNSFDFRCRFLLIITSNDWLTLDYGDPALYERTRIVPGWTTIPVEERLLSYDLAARDGDPGALAWMVEGAVEYLRQRQASNGGTGLLPPYQEMTDALEEWKRIADPVAAFIHERYVRDANGAVTGRELLEGFEEYRKTANVRAAYTRNTLIAKLRELGLEARTAPVSSPAPGTRAFPLSKRPDEDPPPSDHDPFGYTPDTDWTPPEPLADD